MLEAIECVVMRGEQETNSPIVRYELLDRMWRNTKKYGVQIIAFGMGDSAFRWLLSGRPEKITEVLRGFKVGTARRSAGRVRFSAWERSPLEVSELSQRAAWAQEAPWAGGETQEAVNPWCSELDRLGYRRAYFYDPLPLQALLGDAAIERTALPAAELSDGYSLRFLMRLAGAVLGRLPGHHKTFRLFVHLARFFGWDYGSIAKALGLTIRRVRQLDQGAEPLLWTALWGLLEPRLCHLP
jgi:hypothetical protein